jgi:hypothetical protein
MTAVVPRYEVRCVDLGPGPSAEELARRAARWPGLVCLRGAWAGGTTPIRSRLSPISRS